MRLDNGVLKLKEEQALYRDQPVQDGRFKAVAFQSEHRFFVENGKLNYEYDGESFNVNTETMQRSISADNFPPFVSVEQ